MVSTLISLMVAIFLLPSHDNSEKEMNRFYNFLEDRWITEESISTLNSVTFQKGKNISLLFNGNRLPVSFSMLYEIRDYDEKTKRITLAVYQKDLFSEKKSFQNLLYIEIIDDDTIRLENEGKGKLFKRQHKEFIYK